MSKKEKANLGDLIFVHGNDMISSLSGETERNIKTMDLREDSTGGYLPTEQKYNIFKKGYTKIGDFLNKKDVL